MRVYAALILALCLSAAACGASTQQTSETVCAALRVAADLCETWVATEGRAGACPDAAIPR